MSCGAGICARATSPLGFRQADVVVEQTYRTPFVDHVYIETETGIGWIDAEGVLVLRVSTQVLEHFRDVADVLRLPHSRVRLEGAYLGGGFGGKEDVTVECLLGLLVWKTRRPVALIFSREESFIGHGKRHPYVLRYRTGARRDGELVALEAELISDSGAYAALSPWVLFYSLVTATGPYRIPHVHVDAVTAYTNNPIASAYRTFGSIQTCVAYEGQMDALAAALGMDPLELRERNFLRKGDSIATGQVLETEPMLGETMRRAWAALGPARAGEGPVRVGRGLAASFTPYGRMCWTRDSASAWVGMELDGGAVVRCAAPDVGGGQTSSLCSIAAEVLGLPLERRRRGGARQPLHAARGHHDGHAPALHVGQCRAQGVARAAPSRGRSGGGVARGGAGGRRARRRPRVRAGRALARRDARRGGAGDVGVRAPDAGARQVRCALGAHHRSAHGAGQAVQRLHLRHPGRRGRGRRGDGPDARDAASSPATTSARRSTGRARRGRSRAAPCRGWGTRCWKRWRSRTASSGTRISSTTRSRPRSTRPRSRPS